MSLNPTPSPEPKEREERRDEREYRHSERDRELRRDYDREERREYRDREYERDREYHRHGSAGDNGSNIWCGNLPHGITEDALKEKFKRFGTVISCTIPKDPHTNQSRGFGFIVMGSEKEVNDAVAGFRDPENTIRVEKSRRAGPRESTPGRYLGRERSRDVHSRDYHDSRYDRRYYRDDERYVDRYAERRSYDRYPYGDRGYHSRYDYIDSYDYEYGPDRGDRYHGPHHYNPYSRDRRSPIRP